jgi:hypothetical protein
MTNVDDQSIVLTGCGWVTPFAHGGINDVLAVAAEAQRPPASTQPYWAVPDHWLNEFGHFAKELKQDKGAWITAMALEHACRQAGIDPAALEPVRTGMVLGCELAGQLGMIDFASEVREQSARFVSPIHFPQTVGNYISGAIARAYHVRGANLTVATGPASGLDAIVEGGALLSRGVVDVVIAGGVDVLSEVVAEGFGNVDEVSSEGACLFVLERAADAGKRGARVLATIRQTRQLANPDEPLGDPSGQLISIGGCHVPGAVAIDHWTGRCFGAEGAALVAAAIGAGAGLAVPVVGDGEEESVSVKKLSPGDLDEVDGATLATVCATDDSGQRTVAELALPP